MAIVCVCRLCVCVCNLQAILFNRIILPERTAETGERQITLQARASRISNTQKPVHTRTHTHKH